MEEGEFSPLGAGLGALVGLGLGTRVGRGMKDLFPRGFNPRQAARRLILESRGLPPEVAAVRQRLADQLGGRITEAMDTSRILMRAADT